MQRRLALALALMLALLVTASGTYAGAESRSAASRVIDRTFVCTVASRGGVPVVEVQAHWNVIKGPGVVNLASAWVPDIPLAGLGQDIAYANPRRCTRTATPVALRARGLTGGAVDRLSGAEMDCMTPRRVIVRLRAVFRRPTLLRVATTDFTRAYRLLIARGTVTSGFVAVQTQAGKPLVSATLNRAAKASIFTAAGACSTE